jgi:prephenate dehydrogenase
VTPAPGPATVAIIGTGLIGTSIALALREQGSSVWLADQDPAAARLAEHMGAGDPLPAPGREAKADVAVIAVPPDAVADTLAAAQERGLARYYTDVASVKQLPVAQARDRGCDLASYVPGHPLAGREKHGPAAARADLFLGRSWALCPTPETSDEATSAVTSLVRACGAVPVRTTGGWRSSRTPRTWWPRPWPPAWRKPPSRRSTWPARACAT